MSRATPSQTQRNYLTNGQYKDIKCVKVLLKKASEKEALKNCTELDSQSSLITIQSQDEQEFLNKLLGAHADFSKSAWIGMKYERSAYRWVDGTATNYTNWSSDAVKDGTDACVEMSLVSIDLGKWTDESCEKPSLVVCQRKQELNLSLIKNLFQNLSDTIEKQQNSITEQGEKIKSLEQKLEDQSSLVTFPLGFLYTQFPNQTSPVELWPHLSWADVTEEYSGLFFRAEGTGSEPFGKIQQSNQTHISSYKWRVFYERNDKTMYDQFIYEMTEGTWSSIERGWGLADFGLFQTKGEVRPKNTAIKIWKRID